LLDLDELVGLQSLPTIYCKSLIQLSDMHKLMNLQTLKLDLNVRLQSFAGWSNLNLLQNLEVGIDELFDGPDLYKFTKLKHLHISGWQIQGISSLTELVLLESTIVDNCKGIHVLPDLKKLSRLCDLKICWCKFEDWSNFCYLANLEKLEIMYCNKLEVLLDLGELANLKDLMVKGCALLRDLRSILGLENLKLLRVGGNPWLQENLGSDLHQLTSLYNLDLLDGRVIDLQWIAMCSKLCFLDCSVWDLANSWTWLTSQNCYTLTYAVV